MDNKDKIRCLKRLWSIFKSSSKKRGIKVGIDFESYSNLVQSRCGYCGSHPSNLLKYSGLEFKYNGLDRMNSEVGYLKENLIPSCRFCNSLKGSMPWPYWADFINSIVTNFGGDRPYSGAAADRSKKAYFKF